MNLELAKRILDFQDKYYLADNRDNIDDLLRMQYPNGVIQNKSKTHISQLGYTRALTEAKRLIKVAERTLREEDDMLESVLAEAKARVSLDQISINEQRQQWLAASGIEPELAPYVDPSGFHPVLFYPQRKKSA